jgi:hypothetical protein
LTSPAFFAIMPEFSAPRFPWARISVRNKSMNGNAKKLSRLLVATRVVTVIAANLFRARGRSSAIEHRGQTARKGNARQRVSSAKPTPTSSPSTTPAPTTAASSGSVKQQTSQTKDAGMV